jgi:hypothetical protein
MATVSIVLSQCDTKSISGGAMPVAKSQPKATASLTSSGASQQGSFTTAAKRSDTWTITASGGKVWVKFAANPTASAGNDWLVLDGQTRDFGVSVDGEIPAIIDG